MLDGGHIVLALIESVRRKPVNMRVLEVIQTSCAVLIIGYMLYITFFDVQDLPFVRKKTRSTRSAIARKKLANAVERQRDCEVARVFVHSSSRELLQ